MSELHKQLGCMGYYGFGSGYDHGRRQAAQLEEAKAYCSCVCAVSEVCWKRHLERTRMLLPMLCDSFARIEHTSQGVAVRAFELVYNRPNPYTTLMQGNMEDGERVALGGTPLWRGDCTLPWPLEAN